MFATEDDVWRQKTKLAASDGVSGDNFGFSVAVNGAIAIVGSFGHTTSAGFGAGTSYLYQSKDGPWRQVAELSASDAVAAETSVLPWGSQTTHCWLAATASIHRLTLA